MTRCLRCGDRFELRDPTDRYCLACVRELAASAPKPSGWQPEWRRRDLSRDLTRRAA